MNLSVHAHLVYYLAHKIINGAGSNGLSHCPLDRVLSERYELKKSGAKIKTVACLPNGIRRDVQWELPIRAAMLAIRNGSITQGQYDDLRTLAEMTRRTTTEPHLLNHADSIDRILKPVGQRGGHATGNEAASVTASVKVLIDHISCVENILIARASLAAVMGAA